MRNVKAKTVLRNKTTLLQRPVIRPRPGNNFPGSSISIKPDRQTKLTNHEWNRYSSNSNKNHLKRRRKHISLTFLPSSTIHPHWSSFHKKNMNKWIININKFNWIYFHQNIRRLAAEVVLLPPVDCRALVALLELINIFDPSTKAFISLNSELQSQIWKLW